MRVENSIKNIKSGIISQIISTLLAFITRTVFIYTLGLEYLGIEGLFTNILAILSLANIGMETAIIFNLYKPIENNDKYKIKGYMSFYERIYKKIGVFIFIVGLMLIPFLDKIINTDIIIEESIVLIYLLFLINTSISYFYVYKHSILRAAQKTYIISNMHTKFVLISNITQIVMLFVFRAYIPVIVMQIICRILENIYISKIADEQYPFLNDKNIQSDLSIENKKKLYKDIYSMLLYKISATVINSTDNIVISYFVGISKVGIYSNYLLIISTVKTFTSYIFSSLTASVGNLIVSSDNEKKKFMYNQILFTSFWIYGFCSIAFYILFNDFIIIWLKNEKFLLSQFTIIIIIINFYTAGMQGASTMYRDTTGLFNIGKYRPIVAAIINLSVSIILAKKLGISGVILGTIVSRLCIYFWFDPYVIHKYIFKTDISNYFRKYLEYTLVIVIIANLTNLICDLITAESMYVMFISKVIICLVLPNILLYILYHKNKHFKYILNIGLNIIKRKI